MWAHSLGITLATAGIVLATLAPFFPGSYDSLAVPLSLMSRVLGTVGLLLVPIGAVMTSHKSDLLQLSEQELILGHSQGHYAVHDAPQPHWKYFWFD